MVIPSPAPNTQKNEFKIFNNYEINGWNFSLNFIYGSGKAFTEPSYNYNITLLDESELNYIELDQRMVPYFLIIIDLIYPFTTYSIFKSQKEILEYQFLIYIIR